ncbi:hypothetical protein D9M68_529600 [compost metagenome]
MLPAQGHDPLPVAGQLGLPLAAEGEAAAVDVHQVLALQAGGEAQAVGERRVEGDLVPGTDVLPHRRHLGLGAEAMALGVDPVTRPVGPRARADVGGEADAQAHGARLDRRQADLDRNQQARALHRAGVHPHFVEVAAGLEVLAQLGDLVGVVGGVGRKGHQARQQVRVERRVAIEADRAQAVALAACIDQLDIGDAGARVDIQALAGETAVEEAVAQRLVLDQLLGVLVGAVVELGTGLQRLAFGYAKRPERAGFALDPHLYIAQPHRFAGDHQQVQ